MLFAVEHLIHGDFAASLGRLGKRFVICEDASR
jgi:hypothetical protein